MDFQRELSGSQALLISYVGARGDHLGLGGSNDTPVNINQLDPKYLALGAALNQTVAEPVLRQPERRPVRDAGDAQSRAVAAAVSRSSPTSTPVT